MDEAADVLGYSNYLIGALGGQIIPIALLAQNHRHEGKFGPVAIFLGSQPKITGRTKDITNVFLIRVC